MTGVDDYDDVRTIARFEGGVTLTATDGADELLIDESTLADLLGPAEVVLLDRLVNVNPFPTAVERDQAAASPVTPHQKVARCESPWVAQRVPDLGSRRSEVDVAEQAGLDESLARAIADDHRRHRPR